MKDLLQKPTFTEFIRLSQRFTESVGLMSPGLRKFTNSLEKRIETAQIMLGNSLFLFYKEQEVLDELQRSIPDIFQEEICQETVIRRK
jgi:pantoate kinase